MEKKCTKIGEAADAGCVTRLVNLREGVATPRAECKGDETENALRWNGRRAAWHPVGQPLQVRNDGWRPVARLDAPALGAHLRLWLKEQQLASSLEPYAMAAATPADALRGTITAMATPLDSQPVAFEFASASVLRVTLRNDAPCYLSVDQNGCLAHLGRLPELPALGFAATGETNLSEELADIKLSGLGIGATLRLRGKDPAIVSDALVQAYFSLRERARQNGYALQPLLARYRIEDPLGHTLYTSVPTLLQASTGFNCCNPVTMTTPDNYATLTGGSIAGRIFHVMLTAPEDTLPEPWRSLAARVVVELTPGIDPVVAGVQTDVALSQPNGTHTATAYLPGYTSGSINASWRNELVRRTAADPSLFRVYATYTLPFAPAFGNREVPMSGETVTTPLPTALPARDNRWHTLQTELYGLTFSANRHTIGSQTWNIDSLMNPVLNSDADRTTRAYTPGWMEITRDDGSTTASQRLMSGEIHAIAEAPRRDSSWELTHRCVVAAGSDGLLLVTLADNDSIRSVVTLDSRPVESPTAVVSAPGRDGQRLLAIAGGDLVEITRNRVTTLLTDCRATQVAWCNRYREIWLAGGSGPLRRVLPGGEVAEVQLPHFTPQARLFAFAGELMATTSNRLYDLSRENPAPMPVAITAQYTLGRSERLHSAKVDATAFTLDGELTIAGSNGGAYDRLMQASLSGSLRAPLIAKVIAPRRRNVAVTLAATLDPSAEIRSIRLLCYK